MTDLYRKAHNEKLAEMSTFIKTHAHEDKADPCLPNAENRTFWAFAGVVMEEVKLKDGQTLTNFWRGDYAMTPFQVENHMKKHEVL